MRGREPKEKFSSVSPSVRLTEVRLRSRITHCCAELLQLDTDSNIAVVFTRAVGLNDNLISWISVTDKKRKHLCGNRRLQDQSRCVSPERLCFVVAALQFCDGTHDWMRCAHTQVNHFNVVQLRVTVARRYKTICPGRHVTRSGRPAEHP